MNEVLVPLFGWLSDAYRTLGVVLEKNEMHNSAQPAALWRNENLAGADCAEVFDSDLGAWLRCHKQCAPLSLIPMADGRFI